MSLLLALHSSSETLGIACDSLDNNSEEHLKVATFPIGRRLSNDLLTCIESVIPVEKWKRLTQLAVATGPGGFTSTRLTIAVARILAEQLGCPLHGINSLFLAAYRFNNEIEPFSFKSHFWITQNLSQQIMIAGCYAIDEQILGGLREVITPQVVKTTELIQLEPCFNVKTDIEKDVVQLIKLCRTSTLKGHQPPWSTILPLYLTSPLN